MREILGRRRMNRSSPLNAALHCATRWGWPVLPGATLVPPLSVSSLSGSPSSGGAQNSKRPLSAVCSCPDADCAVPGAHPFDPVLLAATTDPRMITWWWTNRPSAPLILATGGRAPSALSLPAIAGARALAEFDRRGERLGPVVATPTRCTLLVEPYDLAELGERLYAHDWVPSSLRFHGEGGYVALPPSHTGAGRVRWERGPVAADGSDGAEGTGANRPRRRGLFGRRDEGARGARRGAGLTDGVPFLPRMESVLDVLVAASATAPDSGTSLTY
ncbi:bifunctional DNA primase/polymerase-like protein [Streptomyces sp. Amel2xB2]|uniref:DNA primase n=1 Tax=Streptomyces nanshensis TaxID=518642 RepID=A0A1E7L7K6_9ACTN|nr:MULTISPECIES: bifunctional DNA primase/polymerase [Streptomyces]OEV12197.1 DNA primase [Streptomyces nanshensis]RAJ66425.1 bifunctional DNA primase/polymerase-like protein [Streptomyces sp. Amel2xB2]